MSPTSPNLGAHLLDGRLPRLLLPPVLAAPERVSPQPFRHQGGECPRAAVALPSHHAGGGQDQVVLQGGGGFGNFSKGGGEGLTCCCCGSVCPCITSFPLNCSHA